MKEKYNPNAIGMGNSDLTYQIKNYATHLSDLKDKLNAVSNKAMETAAKGDIKSKYEAWKELVAYNKSLMEWEFAASRWPLSVKSKEKRIKV